MPSHSSHILQLLDVGCFGPLKHAYTQLVLDLGRLGIFHIDKADFLGIYYQTRQSIINKQNITSGFRATGLVPFYPERVLSQLTYTKTPSPPSTSHGHGHGQASSPWTSETPRNLAQLEKQLQLVQKALQRTSQSPTEPLDKVVKGCQLAMSGAALLAQENRELRAANERLQKKRRVKRRYIQNGGILEVQEARDLIKMHKAPGQIEVDLSIMQRSKRAPYTCSSCKIQGHTIRKCRQTQLSS